MRPIPIVGQLAWIFTSAKNLVASAWNESYANFALRWYHKWIPEHYAEGGRGYAGLNQLNRGQQLAKWDSLSGRIHPFLPNITRLGNWTPHDTVLDVGCGAGQNLKALASWMPTLRYTGFDLDSRAIDFINNVKNVSLPSEFIVNLSAASLLDVEFRNEIQSKSFDHILCSHVFSTLIDKSLRETHRLRFELATDFLRWARKSVIILDMFSHGGYFRAQGRFYIEQSKRGFLEDELSVYFRNQVGDENCHLLFSAETKCLIVKLPGERQEIRGFS
jgi:SAM-dependent methyltransferase